MGRPKSNEEYRLLSFAAITRTALRLFVERGYRNTSVDDIAADSRLTKGAVYYYFKTKEHLLLSILSEIETNWVEQVIPRLSRAGSTPTERLATFATFDAAWAKERPDELMLLIMMSIEFANSESEIKKRIESIYAKTAAALEHIVEEGKKSGEFTAEMPSRDIALFFMSAHDGNMLQWYRSDKDPEIGYILARAYRRAILRIVGAQEVRV
ncbi:MAG: transcriptional regulator, TetR family [Herminiimonas sp.]|jgi:AcrR family transcriptional regulator|nr:transcriptional regulator, TetR family [Herminiimonas sp.]